MEFEEAFARAGSFGKFQIVLTGINFFTNILYGSQLLIMVIVGAIPNKDVPSESNLNTIVTEWNLYDEQWIISLLASLFLAGYMAGSLLFGQLPDLYGRKPVLVLSLFFATTTCFCSAFCKNWKTFAVTRFLGGLFAGGAVAPAFALTCELVGKNLWGSIGMSYQIFFSFGIMLLGLFGYVFKDWRKVMMMSSGMAAVVLPFYVFLVPESPRWLYSVGKFEKAEKIIKLIAKRNGRDDSEIRLEIPEESESSSSDFHKYSLIDVFKRRNLVKKLLLATYVWFACSLSYYGLTVDVSTLMPNIYLGTLLSGAVEIPAYIITIFMIDNKWLGRHGTMVFLLLTSSLSSTCLLFTGDADEETTTKVVLGLISKLAIAAAFSVMYIYISEIFPTQTRTVCLVFGNAFARIAGIIAFFVPLMGKVAFFLPYAIFGLANLIAGAATIPLPETRGRRVTTMKDFEVSNRYRNSDSNTNDQVDNVINDDENEPLLKK